MKIFLDTNIFLDLILKRKNYKESLLILNGIEQKKFKGYVLDVSLINIDYIAKKQVKNIKNFLNLINNIFKVVGANNKIIKEALNIDNNDFEDSVQYTSAIENGCDFIITNDKKFYSDVEINIVSSVDFINKIYKKEMK